ncbi:hypothetical protein Fmac_030181 [Flemingia macrophylla]|uniref:Dehydrin n=1 Tax=Flemingia macrophylla TaxID=520843 RepID=A0ABD1LCG3_9FABA
MASYQSHYDDQGRRVDEYGNIVTETDQYGNPVHGTAATVTYVTSGATGETGKQHESTGIYSTTGRDHQSTGDRGIGTDRQKQNESGNIGRQYGTTDTRSDVYDISRQHDSTGRQHATGGYGGGDTGLQPATGGYGGGDTGWQHGTGGYGGGDTGRQYGTTAGGDPHYGVTTADTGTGPRSGTTGGACYGMNSGGARTDVGKEYRHHDESRGDHEKKGIMDKIKEKLPGGNSDK